MYISLLHLAWFSGSAAALLLPNRLDFSSSDSALGPPHLSRRALSCSKTADCTAAGASIPSNSHQFCKSGSCSFQCNTNYSLVSGACVKTVTSTSTTSSAAPSATIKSCSKTADCDGATIPVNSHQYCKSNVSSFNCNTGYSLVSGACIKLGSTSSSSSSSSATTSKTTTKTTTKATSTTSSAAATSSTIACSNTADCTAAGAPIPANSHQYCKSKVCTFSCNSKYTLVDGACIASGITTTTSSSSSSAKTTTTTKTSAITSSATPTSATSSSTTQAPSTSSSVSPTSTSVSSSSSTSSSSTSSSTTSSASATPSLVKTYSGSTFFDDWTFEAIEDPTHGLVTYVNASTAWDQGLASINSDGSARISIDRTSTLAAGVNRSSVRIKLLNDEDLLDVGSLVLADLQHAPWGCSVWSSLWAFGPDWPYNGEIDVYEGINSRTYGQYTLHTYEGCYRDTSVASTGFTGSRTATSCNAITGSGCSVQDKDSGAYGEAFNDANGGVFALAIETSGISIWRWKRADIPADVTSGSPTPSTWGTPVAAFGSGTCPIASYFNNLSMVFDITTCGDWAGSTGAWRSTSQSGSCYSSKYPTCASANQDPANFAEAYFDVNYIKVFSI